jgi:hypothetical protein
MAAREATSGRRAHQTCKRLGGRGKWRHRRALTQTLNANFRNRQPAFNKSGVGHCLTHLLLRAERGFAEVSKMRNADSTRRGFLRCMAIPSQ